MGRAPCCDKANVKKGPWAPEEDAKLKDFIDKYGTGGNWIALPQKAGLNRCGKSCRLRWLNYLRPNIKHGEFSEEEERIICSLFANIGSRWSIIAAQLPGRTDNDIKNYWNTKLKKKFLGIVSTHHCKTQHHHQLQLQQQQQQQQQQLLQHYLSPLVTSSSSLMQTPKLEAFAGFGDPPLAAAFYQNALGFASRSNSMINFGSDPSSSSSSSSCATVQLEYGCDDGKGFEEEQITASVDHYSFRGLEDYSRLLAGAETTPVHYTYEEAIKNLLSSN